MRRARRRAYREAAGKGQGRPLPRAAASQVRAGDGGHVGRKSGQLRRCGRGGGATACLRGVAPMHALTLRRRQLGVRARRRLRRRRLREEDEARLREGSEMGRARVQETRLCAPRTWRADTTPAPAPRPVVSAMCTMREVRSRKRVVCRSANWATDASDATETRVMPAGGAVWYSRSSTFPTGSSDSSSAASGAAALPPSPAPRAGRAASSDADVATPRAVAASIRHRSDRSGVEEEREREKPRGERPAAASTGRTGTCDSPSAERIWRSREAKPWTAAASVAVVTLLTRGAPRCRRVSRCVRGVPEVCPRCCLSLSPLLVVVVVTTATAAAVAITMTRHYDTSL